jgi:hypothetical protein
MESEMEDLVKKMDGIASDSGTVNESLAEKRRW